MVLETVSLTDSKNYVLCVVLLFSYSVVREREKGRKREKRAHHNIT